jgi:hypothetical protein
MLLFLLLLPGEAPAVTSIFPAGGQRGATVKVRVAGLNLHESCGWSLSGKGLALSPRLKSTRTVWFEGPILPLPDSQRQEDYPKDLAGTVTIAADAPLGPRRLRAWTSEGAAAGPVFVVGELPEVVEEEAEGDPVPVRVSLPVTINGRIFPREDLDDWTFEVKKGQMVTAEAHAERIGSKLDSRLELFDPEGKRIAENDDARGSDSVLRFTAAADGVYRLRISDSQRGGSQAHVYRLTVTAGPFVDHVYPAGGRAGARAKFTFSGANLPAAERELTLPAEGLDTDTLPEHREGDGKLSVPGVINGRISKPGEVDDWAFEAKKGQPLEVEARPIPTSLHPIVTIDDAGKAAFTLSGARGVFTPSRDGVFHLRVRDRFASRGGPGHIYRIRVAPAEQSFRLTLPHLAVSLLRKGEVKVRVNVERRGGHNEPVALSVTGLPRGVEAFPVTVGPGQAQGLVTLRASWDAALGPAELAITGTAKGVTAQADEALLLGVGLKAPFKYTADYDLRLAPRGSTFRKRFRIEREPGFTGPLEARLGDHQNRHLQGVTGPPVAIPADARSFDFAVDLPPWMEIGRTSRSVIVLVGKVMVDGVEHTVSYGAEGQSDQIIAVVEAGLLGVEVDPGTLGEKGGEVRVRLRRSKDTPGPVTVTLEVPSHVRGVSCAPVTVAAGEESAVLKVQVAPEAGPLNCPLKVRAELKVKEGRLTAEAPLRLARE